MRSSSSLPSVSPIKTIRLASGRCTLAPSDSTQVGSLVHGEWAHDGGRRKVRESRLRSPLGYSVAMASILDPLKAVDQESEGRRDGRGDGGRGSPIGGYAPGWQRRQSGEIGAENTAEVSSWESRDLNYSPPHAASVFNIEDSLASSIAKQRSNIHRSRVGTHSGIWNLEKPAYAVRGMVRSRLPTLEGVLGLERLSQKYCDTFPKVYNPTEHLHPTYLSSQQKRCSALAS